MDFLTKVMLSICVFLTGFFKSRGVVFAYFKLNLAIIYIYGKKYFKLLIHIIMQNDIS